MAHFAKINENNIVEKVLIINDTDVAANGGEKSQQAADWVSNNFGGGVWKQVSYNTINGRYYTPNTNNLDPDQTKAFRKNYPGVGSIYHPTIDGFSTKKPYPSWILNEEACIWIPPVAYPNINNTGIQLKNPDSGLYFMQRYDYEWVEEMLRWEAKTYNALGQLENNWIWNPINLQWEINNG